MNKLFNTHPLVVDNFNLYQMDRTLWYTINYDGLAHTQNKNKIGKDKDSKLRYSMVK